MKNLFKYTFLFLLSFVCSYSFAAENTASATTAETVTFEISGSGGTYKFFYPEQKIIYHNGVGTTTVTMNVTATTVTSAVVEVQVTPNKSETDQIAIMTYGSQRFVDLNGDGPYFINFFIPLDKGNQTARLILN